MRLTKREANALWWVLTNGYDGGEVETLMDTQDIRAMRRALRKTCKWAGISVRDVLPNPTPAAPQEEKG
jgi:hypothetical protein